MVRSQRNAQSQARRLISLVAAMLLSSWPAAASAAQPFEAKYAGTFVITFGTGPLGTDELFFEGIGSGRHIGDSTVDGYSQLRDSRPGCKEIVHDEVTLTSANGDELFVVNEGEDCIDLSDPNRIVIRGTGTYEIVGGSGRFADASGTGSVAVTAEVETITPTMATGTFDPLTFDGDIST